jgi:hypothetical protein
MLISSAFENGPFSYAIEAKSEKYAMTFPAVEA